MIKPILAVLFWILMSSVTYAQSVYGPQASITCPVGATVIETTDNAPAIAWAAANGTVFCLEAGTHTLTEPIQMRQGQQFWGEYGAIVEGASVVQGYDEDSAAIFRAWGCGVACAGGVIKNLVIRNFATKQCIGIYGTGGNADDWVIDHNELSGCRYGVNVGYNDGVQITNNYIHHNNDLTNQDFTGGYGANVVTNLTLESNEIAYNGPNQKIITSTGTTFRDNYVHHNTQGIWMDGDHVDVTIVDNQIEDHTDNGIFYEVSGAGVVRGNTILRSGGLCIFVSTSRDIVITENTCRDNFRGIGLLVNCSNVHVPNEPYVGAIGWDLRNNLVVNNNIYISALSGALANYLTYSTCTAGELTPYTDGTKNIVFESNDYYAAVLTTEYWIWGDPTQSFTEWQAEGRDDSGSLSYFPGGEPPPGDTTAPVVGLSATVRGPNIRIITSCSDNITCTRFEVRFDGALVSSVTGEFIVKKPSKGQHFVTAQGWDAAGNTTTANATVTR